MRTVQRKDRKIKSNSQKITNVVRAGHQIGWDGTFAQQKRQNEENGKRRDDYEKMCRSR